MAQNAIDDVARGVPQMARSSYLQVHSIEYRLKTLKAGWESLFLTLPSLLQSHCGILRCFEGIKHES